MGAHTSYCADLGRVLCSQLLWPPFFSHCASFASISIIPPPGHDDIIPSRPGMESELGSLEGPGNAITANSRFPGKSPSGIYANGVAEASQRQTVRPSQRYFRTRRAPNVFRVLNHALATAPFECGSLRYRYMSAILVRAIGNKAGPVRSAMANRTMASRLRIGASHCCQESSRTNLHCALPVAAVCGQASTHSP